MRLPEHIRFDLLGDEQHGPVAWAHLKGLAVAQRVVAEDPRNWFTRLDDSAPEAKQGFGPPQNEGEDWLYGGIWDILRVEDVAKNVFTYTVLDDLERYGEPVRRWGWSQRVDGQVTQADVNATRAAMLDNVVRPIASRWMPDLLTGSDAAVRVKVHAPVEVRDETERRIRWVTDVTWMVLSTTSGKAPGVAREQQHCLNCRWWGPLCGHADKLTPAFVERLESRARQQDQGLEAMTCLGWAGQPGAVAPVVQSDRIETEEVFDHFAAAPSSLLSEPS